MKGKGEEEPGGRPLAMIAQVANISSISHNVYSLTTLYHCPLYCLSISLSDESEEGEEVRPLTKDEEEVEVMQSWVEAGGFQLAQKKR